VALERIAPELLTDRISTNCDVPAEAHPELTNPGLSKGRPSPGGEGKDEQQPSNAGTDGP
jgi:hypothetical protein